MTQVSVAGKEYSSEVHLDAACVSDRVVELAKWISDHQISAVCWDFDETAMSIHTGGYLTDTSLKGLNKRVSDLTHQVAPGFRTFCRYVSLNLPNVQMAIASFADDFSRKDVKSSDRKDVKSFDNFRIGGTELIERVLKYGFGWPRPAFHIVSFFPEVANSVNQFATRVSNNKNMHLEQIAKQLKINDKSKILLIDNDMRNLLAAKENGHHAWYVKDQKGFDPETLVIL